MASRNNVDSPFKLYGFEGYDKETLNNIKQKHIRIITSNNKLIKTIKKSLIRKEIKTNYVMGTISEETKIKIEEEIEEIIFKHNQYSLIISNDSIKHIHEHFSSSKEIRKQILRVANIVAKFDKISKISKGGETRLVFEKKYTDGNIRMIVTVSKSNNSLNLVSIFYTKRKRDQVCDAVTTISKGNPQSDSISNQLDNIIIINKSK